MVQGGQKEKEEVMKTKKDVVRILRSGNHDFCEPEVKEALEFLEKNFEDNDTIDKIASYAPERWAYYWARDIGDREIMRDRITESRWAYYWALNIGDRDIMRDRITESGWAYYWAHDIGDRE